MTSSHVIWYAARSAGLVSWALLAAAVLWGLALSTGAMRRWAKPAWLLDLHRYLGGLALIFTGIHVSAILLDTYVHFGLTQVLVPLTSTWHPVAVTWGVLAFYLLAAVEITSLLRRRLPRGLWRRVHYATLPLFAVATVHGLTAGTDRTSMAVIFAAALGVVTVGALGGLRLAHIGKPKRSTGAVPSAIGGRTDKGHEREKALNH
jgi:DMSO/TMAO reductase YedYZ heme-binding membrane subunit